ncbi:hypothetical protein [Oceanicoccus sagamiensis]|uniref:Uncharacterized protein n=1 Tax=Oceanicoccus sagamiensis TaxID=716816 RepID=A0A1X9N7F5_9GAMM|nr:hypothetical protein [Oceanicoccus sagamiensis]ARN74008.1 hypothetical protein BST96_07675 [Oceanicoccus sagamiensis]
MEQIMVMFIILLLLAALFLMQKQRKTISQGLTLTFEELELVIGRRHQVIDNLLAASQSIEAMDTCKAQSLKTSCHELKGAFEMASFSQSAVGLQRLKKAESALQQHLIRFEQQANSSKEEPPSMVLKPYFSTIKALKVDLSALQQ